MYSKARQVSKRKLKDKPCQYKGCKKPFKPVNGFHVCCSPLCATLNAQDKAEKKKKREAAAALKAFNQQDISYMKEKAQKTINKYARLRDYGKPCISCGVGYFKRQVHGGHFRSQGNNSAIRYNLWNINAQCAKCNTHEMANVSLDYEANLKAKIGEEKVEWLKSQTQAKKYDIEYLQRLDRIFMKRIRILEKRIKRR